MPEGHTIHRLARDFNRDFSGQVLQVSSPQGRFSDDAAEFDGRVFNKADAKGKHLFLHWDDDSVLHLHLGLYGKVRRYRQTDREVKGEIRVRMIGDSTMVDIHGPNQCERFDSELTHQKLSSLGEDPLRDDADVNRLVEKLGKTRRPIGVTLMDQSIIAGLGNIYRTEILFLCGIDPRKPSCDVSADDVARIWQASMELLKVGVRYNRIIIPDDANEKSLGRYTKAERLRIYKRSRCPACEDAIETFQLAQRNVFACNRCQS